MARSVAKQGLVRVANTGKVTVEVLSGEPDPQFVIITVAGDDGVGTSIRAQIPPEARELLKWWIFTATRDAERTIPKMFEYGGGAEGSADLQLMGENLATLLDMHDAPDAVKQEMACWFYLQGKIARLVSDYKAHRAGKGDTWFDAEIYAKMARRIQEHGQWP